MNGIDPTNGLYLPILKIKPDRLIYKKPIKMKNLYHMSLYYLSKEEKKRFIIQTPKMLLFSDIKCFEKQNDSIDVPSREKFEGQNDKKSYRMSLSFKSVSTLYHDQELRDFRKMLRGVDVYISQLIEKNKKNWNLPDDMVYKPTLRKIAPDAPWMMSVNLPYDSDDGFLFNIYDKDAQIINIDDLGKRKVVTSALELTEIWFSVDTCTCQLKWNALQIRKFSKFSPLHYIMMKQCVLPDMDDPNDEGYQNVINVYRKRIQEQIGYMAYAPIPFTQQPMMQMQHNIPMPPAPPRPPQETPVHMKYAPSKNDLLDQLKKLKSTKKEEGISDEDDKKIEEEKPKKKKSIKKEEVVSEDDKNIEEEEKPKKKKSNNRKKKDD